MKGSFFKNIMFLVIILVISLLFASYNFAAYNLEEGFSSLSPNVYPKSDEKVILNDFPQIGKNSTSNNSYEDLWKYFPVFPLGSYEQTTNNIRYPTNPDNGTCIRADFCGALYHNTSHAKSNVVTPLPPAEEGSGARVGYFRTEPNELYYSIPTNENILY